MRSGGGASLEQVSELVDVESVNTRLQSLDLGSNFGLSALLLNELDDSAHSGAVGRERERLRGLAGFISKETGGWGRIGQRCAWNRGGPQQSINRQGESDRKSKGEMRIIYSRHFIP